MYRIALNVAISFYRKEKNARPWLPFSESLIIFDDTLEANTEAEEHFSLLQKFISGLKEIDKSIMLLYLDDKSYKEIAEITGITESNVATKINRIKDKLRSNFSAVKNNQYGTN